MAGTSPVLVTGGFGAIGSFVLRQLVADGQPVVVYSRHRRFSLVSELQGLVAHEEGDVQDTLRLGAVVEEYGVRRIIHLAAAVSPELEREPTIGYQVNVMGGLSVFNVARDQGLERVVFTSSKAYYGRLLGTHSAPTFEPVDEDYVGQTSNVYGATKKALEDAAHHYRRLFNVDLIALRLGSTYGPGKDAAGHAGGYSAIKSRMIESAVRGEPFTVPWPDTRDDIVYNADVARAAILACFGPRTEHWQFNVASGQTVSLRELATEVMRLAPGHQLTIDESPEVQGQQHPQSRTAGVLSIDRARAELGYEPAYPGVSGVADYLQLYRAQLRSVGASR